MNSRSPTADQGISRGPVPRTTPQRQTTLPVIPHHKPNLELACRGRLEALAERYKREEPNLANTTPFGDRVGAGLAPYPSLVLEDHSGITLYETVGDTSYSYRACMLAGDDDVVVVGIKRCPAFEDYCRHTLGFGDFDIVSPPPEVNGRTLSIRCAQDPSFVQRIAERAWRSGGLNVVPYMGTGGTWHLAGCIASASGAPITVAAPPPRLTRRVNDKVWFSRCVREALGSRAQPRTFAAYGLATVLREVSLLARRDAAVAVKLPSSASSSGNLILDTSAFSRLSLPGQRQELETLLTATGWRGDFPLLVSTWESPVLASPSVQLWIPGANEGEVVVEGIFDQILAAPKFEFCGATPTRLARTLQERLVNEAAALGFLFQRLGYFGRCSLDSILVKSSESGARINWVECNGRWGGTSIPMTVGNRLVEDWARVPLAICERTDDRAPRWPFEVFCRDMEALLFRRDGPPVGAVVLTPSRIESGAGYEFLVFGRDPEDLRTRVRAIAEIFATRSASG